MSRPRNKELRDWTAYERLRKERLAAQGKCYRCRGDAAFGHKVCSRCMDKRRMYAAGRRKDLRAIVVIQSTVIRRSFQLERRRDVIDAYGGVCVCCNESRHEFLSVDKIGDRLPPRIVGANIYSRLWKRGFPDGFQVLCWNCNMVRYYRSQCFHQNERRAVNEQQTTQTIPSTSGERMEPTSAAKGAIQR